MVPLVRLDVVPLARACGGVETPLVLGTDVEAPEPPVVVVADVDEPCAPVAR